MKIILLLSFITLGINNSAYAESVSCSLGLTEPVYFSSSYETGKEYFYDSKGNEFSDKKIDIPNCKTEFGNFVMIGTGIRFVPKNPGVGTIAFKDKINPYQCTYNNLQTSFGPLEAFEKRDIFSKEANILRNCLEFKLTEKGNQKLIYDKKQDNCEINKIDDFNVIIKGGRCFFKNHELAKLSLSVQGSGNCKERDFLKNNNISPSEIDAEIFYYYTGDNKGETGYLNLVGKTKIWANIGGGQELYNLTEDSGTVFPQYPDSWVFPKLNIGKLSLKTNKKRSSINIPFIIENRCKKLCKKGVCSSPCGYFLPLGAQITLYQLNKRNKFRVVDEWYQGALIPPNWQGALSSFQANHILSDDVEIKDGSRFKLEISFGDPKYNYEMVVKQMKSKLNLMAFKMPTMGNGRISDIPTLGMPFSPDDNNLPTYDDLPIVGEGHLLSENFSKEEFQSLRDLIKYNFWPPYYEKICNQELSKCVNASLPEVVKYNLEFTIKSGKQVNSRRLSRPGLSNRNAFKIYDVDNIIMEKSSLIDGGFKRKMNTEDQIDYTCKRIRD
jgi:hypothetical protein